MSKNKLMKSEFTLTLLQTRPLSTPNLSCSRLN